MFSNRPCMRRFVEFEEDPEEVNINSVNCLPLPILNDGETMDYKLDEIELSFKDNTIYGIAQLFITSQRIIIRVKEKDTSLEFDPQYIVLHAITRDVNSYPKPCLYCQLDKEFESEEEEEEEEEEDDEEEDDKDVNNLSNENNIEDNKRKFSSTKSSSTTNNIPNPNLFVLLNPSEMYLAPKDENDLLAMFEAFSRVALLNPDEPEDGEDEGDDDLFYNINEVELGASQAQTLQHLESVFHLPGDKFDNGQYDDAN